MNLIIICLIALLVCGGGGHYMGHTNYGFGGAGSLILLLIVLRVFGVI
jgi:hypothetical protein